jgi:hypothetical protein
MPKKYNEVRSLIAADVHRKIRQRAYSEGLTLATWVRFACLQALAQPKQRRRAHMMITGAKANELRRLQTNVST